MSVFSAHVAVHMMFEQAEPLYLSAFQRFCILLLRQFCDEFSQSCNLHNFKFRNILFA